MFENAARKKFRYKTENGFVTTEDLFAMSLDGLNKIAILLHKEIAEKATPSNGSLFVVQKVDTASSDKLAIVKHIFNTKLAAAEAHEQQEAKAERRRQLLEIRNAKEVDQLKSKTIEEIDAELAALN